MRIRGNSNDLDNAVSRGRRAEEWAMSFFRNRGHEVKDCAHLKQMHDIEVSEFGKVQVKRAFLVNKFREKPIGSRIHLDGLHRRRVYRVKLSAGNTGARYPADAWDWLCIVFVLSDGPRFMLRTSKQCTVDGKDYMRDTINIAISTAVTCWRELEPAAELLLREAAHGEALPE
jgi:hypothetical protein